MENLSKKEELDYYKEQIDMRSLLENNGYIIDKTRHSRKHHAYLHPATQDKLVVPIKSEQAVAKFYFNQHDRSDKGSVVDFVMSRQQKSLEEARAYLKEYSGNGYENLVPSQAAVSKRKEKSQDKDRSQRVDYVVNQISSQKDVSDKNLYLEQRFIQPEVIKHAAFRGKIKEHTYKDQQFVAFMMEDEMGEVRSVVLKNHQKNHYLGHREGLFISGKSHHQGKVDQVIINSESPIESMSYFQQEKLYAKPDNTISISTAGNPSNDQLKQVYQAVEKHQPDKIVLINNNDPAGRQYDKMYRELFKSKNIPIEERKAQFQDFNADIKAEQVYQARLLSPNTNPSHPYPNAQPASDEVKQWVGNKEYHKLAHVDKDDLRSQYVTYSIKQKDVQFSVPEVAMINNDRKLVRLLETNTAQKQEQVADQERLINQNTLIEKAKEVSNPTIIQTKEALPEIKNKVVQGMESEKKIKAQAVSFSTPRTEKEPDPYQAFLELKKSYIAEIHSIQQQIKGQPQYEALNKRLEYYRKYPHLSEDKVDKYLSLESKQQDSENQREKGHGTQRGPLRGYQQEIQ